MDTQFNKSIHASRITQFLDDAPAMIAILNGPGHVFEYANKLYLSSINRTKEIIGLTVQEAIPELAGQGIFEILDEVYRTGESFKKEEIKVNVAVSDRGLEEMYFNLIYQAVKNDAGESTGIFVHAVNVSALVAAKHAAEESRENLENIILNAPVATALYTGQNFKISLGNEQMLSFWQKDDSIIGHDLAVAVPELIGWPFLQLLDEVYITGITYHSNEQKFIMGSGDKKETRWFNFSYKPLFDKNGKVYGILNMAIDVSYHVASQERLARTEEKLRNAIEVANLGTWEYDIHSGRITMNETLMNWRGLDSTDKLSVEETLDVTPQKEQLRPMLSDAISGNAKSSMDSEYDIINQKTDEQRRVHSRGKTFYDAENKPVLIAGITQDITSQQDLSDKIAAQTADLENANTALRKLNKNLEQFVYIASHDLQEPLRKINVFSDMLTKNEVGMNDEGKMYLDKIAKAAKRMSLLISDLLEFSQVTSKETAFVPTDLNRIIGNVKVDYELLINQKDATIEIDSLPVIEAIPLQMNQLFYNLLGNSLKFTRDDVRPHIRISCEAITAEERTALKLNDLPCCKISVKDNGIGFDQEYAHQIFEVFQRLHGKHEYAGTGIGLSLAKKIADNHGGTIAATSQENEGAVFNVYLPVSRE